MWTWEDLRTSSEIDRLDAASRATLALAEAAGLDLTDRSMVLDTGFVDRLRSRLGAPATLTVIGQVSAGKSSFVNSLVGRPLLPTSGRPTDGVVSVLMYAVAPEAERAERVGRDGVMVSFATIQDGLRFADRAHTRSADQADCREVRFYLHEPFLQNLRIVNTPGLGDRLEQFERTALDYLREDESDLIAWIFFPDAAANHNEIETFATVLERRREAVLGIVTRSMDGHYGDSGYDPRTDASLAEVVGQIREELGVYLADTVLYDSRVAGELVGKLRADPTTLMDEGFLASLERCGYAQVERLIDQAARRPDGQVRSWLKRCSETTRALAETVEDTERLFHARSAKRQEAREAWLVLHRDVIEPARTALLSGLGLVADERATELAETAGRIAGDVITSDFTLGKVFRSTGFARYFTGKRPLAEQLSNRIQSDLRKTLEDSGFDRRVTNEYRRVVQRHLNDLELRLNRQGGPIDLPVAGPGSVGAHSVGNAAVGTPGVVGRAVARAMTRIVANVAAGLAEKVAERSSSKAAARAGEAAAAGTAAKAGGQAVATAAGQATKAGMRVVVGQVVAKLLTVYTVVTAPLDVKNLYEEFGEGQGALLETLKKRFLAEKGTYERHINAQFAEAVDGLFHEITEGVRQALDPGDQAGVESAAGLVEAGRLRAELSALSGVFNRAAR